MRAVPYILSAAGLALFLFGLALKPDPSEHDATLREGSDGFMGIGILMLVIGFTWAVFIFLGRLIIGKAHKKLGH